MVQVISLTGSLSHTYTHIHTYTYILHICQVRSPSQPSGVALTCEHGVTAVVHGDVVDELHDDHGLAHTSSAKQTDLATLTQPNTSK